MIAGGWRWALTPALKSRRPRFILEKGDSLIIYTDGVSEAKDMRGHELEMKRLEQLVAEAHGHSARKIGGLLEQVVMSHSQGSSPTDDISFVVITRGVCEGEREGQILPESVKVVNYNTIKAAPSPAPSAIEAGHANGHWVIRLQGKATWQEGKPLKALVVEACEHEAEAVHLDLSKCDSVDSTLLGLMLQFSRDLTPPQPYRQGRQSDAGTGDL